MSDVRFRLREVQKASGLPKPTCYRLIQSLLEQRLIEQPAGDGKFVIGERLIRIALLGKSDVDVPQMRGALAAQCGDSIQ